LKFELSSKTKEAIKVSIAFVLVYIIALRFDWMNPYWAGFSVAIVASAPSGESIHKGLNRLFGTIPGVLVAFIIFSIALQDRWLFISLSALWVSFTSYMMINSPRNDHFWVMAGSVALVILTTPPDSSLNIFYLGILRVLETALGVIVYTVVTIFIWPVTDINKLNKISKDLITSQAKLFKLSLYKREFSNEFDKIQTYQRDELRYLTSLKQAYEVDKSISYSVEESINLWIEFHSLSTELMQTLNRFYSSLSTISHINIDEIFPNINDYKNEIDLRFEFMIKHFDGDIEYKTKKITISLNDKYLKKLSPFDQIAVISRKHELENIDRLTKDILISIHNLLDNSATMKIHKIQINADKYVPQKEAFKAALYVGANVIIGYMIWILFDPISHNIWTILPAVFAMAIAATPQLKLKIFFFPLLINLIIALSAYIFILPHLTTYVGLSALYFLSIFLVTYFLPQQIWLFSFVGIIMILKVENHQVYSFISQASFTLSLLMTIAVPYFLSYFLGSPRPEKKLIYLVKNYFRAIESLVLDSKKKNALISNIKSYFYKDDIEALPIYINRWSKNIDYKYYFKNTQNQVDNLISDMFSLNMHIKELNKVLEIKQSQEISKEIKDAITKWKKSLEMVCKHYVEELDTKLSISAQNNLDKYKQNIEISINNYLTVAKLSNMNEDEKNNFFRLIGAFQNVTIALITYAKSSQEINWKHWDEERFS
jgi:uncharacterized membrane protein YgaE (UPF0421/DUF939 family)/predicted Zn-dependent protease